MSISLVRRRIVAVGAVAVVALASCGGGGGGAGADVTVPQATGQNQSTGLVPNPNGFAFPNFGSAASPEVFNEADLVEMFGNTPEVCVKGASPCVATAEAAGWARMVNEARAAGHCEGFAVLAAARFAAKEQPNTVELVNQGDVTHALMRAFATQFFQETKDATKKIVKKSMRDKVAILDAAFAKKQIGDVIGVYSDVGGHALLPYAVEYQSPDVARIMIYDSNWPGQERFITVDMAADTWTFPFSGPDPANDPGAWTGGTKDFDIAPYDARIAGTCPFCKGDAVARQTLLVIRSVAADWTVTTPDGTLTPGSNDVGDASVRPLRSSAPTTGTKGAYEYLLTIPADQKVTLNLPSLTRVTGVTKTAAIQVDTPGSAKAPVEVAPDSVSTNDPAAVITLADGNFVGTSNGANNSVTTDGAQVTVTVNGADGTPVTATANDTATAVDVRTPGRDGVDATTNYEVVTQSAPDQVDRKVVNVDGTAATTTEAGRLANTTVYQEPPAELKDPAVKAGLPSADSRAIGTAATATTTTTVTGETTTSGPTTTSPAGTATTVKKQTSTTVAPQTTVKTQTTTAQNASTRKNVTVAFNLDNWSAGISDPVSSGFTAKLSGGAGQLASAQVCKDVACLETAGESILGGGTDAASGGDVTVPVTFNMTGAAATFSVRCGTGGSWVAASQSGGSYSASCSFANVTSDETVYLRS